MKLNRHSDQGVNATISSVSGTPASVTNSGQKLKRGRKLKPKNSPAVESIKKKKRGRKNVQENQATATASTSDEDEECSAVNCVRPAGEWLFRFSVFFCLQNSGNIETVDLPIITHLIRLSLSTSFLTKYIFHLPTGREVDWVQCDGGCNKWYHMYCVGLVKNQIKADEDFVCKKCKKVSKTLADAKDNCDKTNDDSTPNKPTELDKEDDPDGTKINKTQTMEISDTDESHTKKK